MNASECPEDLLIRERRGTLDLVEQRALAEHAAACELCSLSRGLGRDLAVDPLPSLTESDRDAERDGEANPEEETRLALIVARALLMRGQLPRTVSLPAAASTVSVAPSPGAKRANQETRRRGSRAPRRFAVAAALLLLAGSASAALWRWSAWTVERARREEQASSPASRARGPHRRGPGGIPAEVAPAPAEEPRAIEEPAPAPAPSVAPVQIPPARVAAAPPPPPVTATHHAPADVDLDARALFVAAGHARRAGHFSEAARLYQRLQVRFPGSPEATLSFLSLADSVAVAGRARAGAGAVRRLSRERRQRDGGRGAGRARAHAGASGTRAGRARGLARTARAFSAVGLSLARAAAPRRRERHALSFSDPPLARRETGRSWMIAGPYRGG